MISAAERRTECRDLLQAGEALRRAALPGRSVAIPKLSSGCLGNPVREGTDHSGGAVGNVQPGVDVLQVSAHRSLRQPELASDLEIATAASDEVQ